MTILGSGWGWQITCTNDVIALHHRETSRDNRSEASVRVDLYRVQQPRKE